MPVRRVVAASFPSRFSSAGAVGPRGQRDASSERLARRDVAAAQGRRWIGGIGGAYLVGVDDAAGLQPPMASRIVAAAAISGCPSAAESASVATRSLTSLMKARSRLAATRGLPALSHWT